METIRKEKHRPDIEYFADIQREYDSPVGPSTVRIAMLIRAYGLSVVHSFGLGKVSVDDLHRFIWQFENEARQIENLSNGEEVKQLLRQWGYV